MTTPLGTVVSFPNAFDIVMTRHYAAPIELVFDVFTKREHVLQTFAPFGEEFTVCDIDFRVGGTYHYVLVPPGKPECSFRGTFLTINRPNAMEATWHFDGWPDVDARESLQLEAVDGGTTMTWRLSFQDLDGRAHMTKTDGPEANFESIARYLDELIAADAPSESDSLR
jgi:uncharacterized protein YndB with AHSA1/START domain